jgi:hypothetical protein
MRITLKARPRHGLVTPPCSNAASTRTGSRPERPSRRKKPLGHSTISGAGGGVGRRRFACTPREASETGGKCALFEHDVFGQPGAVRRASSRTPVSGASRGESRRSLDRARLAGSRPHPPAPAYEIKEPHKWHAQPDDGLQENALPSKQPSQTQPDRPKAHH